MKICNSHLHYLKSVAHDLLQIARNVTLETILSYACCGRDSHYQDCLFLRGGNNITTSASLLCLLFWLCSPDGFYLWIQINYSVWECKLWGSRSHSLGAGTMGVMFVLLWFSPGPQRVLCYMMSLDSACAVQVWRMKCMGWHFPQWKNNAFHQRRIYQCVELSR